MPRKRRSTRRRRVRRNPTSTRRRIVSRARASFSGVNYRTALKTVPINVIGMFIAKWGAKRGTPAALEDDRSTWNGMTYLKGALAGAAGGYLANMIRPGTGQKVVEGAFSLLLYKAAENHLMPKSSWAMNQFGAATGGGYAPGDVETNSAGEPFILGADGQWVPMDEGGGAPDLMGMGEDWEMMGDSIEEAGRLGLGDYTEAPGRLGLGYESPTSSAYARALFDR
jgi:hypothetical protein